jgi:hypothetical protein
MMIEQTRCPRCAVRRIARLGTWGRFCFNCRTRLDGRELEVSRPQGEAPYPFQAVELLRLERYRAAIQAGLYSDWPEDGQPDSTELMSTDAV